jgi:hypothetical protein
LDIHQQTFRSDTVGANRFAGEQVEPEPASRGIVPEAHQHAGTDGFRYCKTSVLRHQ